MLQGTKVQANQIKPWLRPSFLETISGSFNNFLTRLQIDGLSK